MQHWFAAQVGVHPTLVSKWVCGDRLPNHAQAVEIEGVTGGAVPLSEWGYTEDRRGIVPSGDVAASDE